MPVTSTAWLSSLLGPVGLSVPDGRPLYAYRCSTERFEEARDVLAGWRPLRDPGAGGRVFAVYAAEWWQRHYDGGPWAWQPLLDSIRCEAAFPELYEPLRNAWRWWGVRPVVLGASVRYLGTCACQGGLPLHFVSSPHSNVRRFLRALLREYRTFRRVVDDGYTLAEPLRSYLPRSLRQEPVYRLCAEVMDQIWELRGVGSQQDDPVAELDRQTPEWRSRMPIDLGDAQARQLIDSLLRDAATADSTTAGEFQVLRYITDTAAGRRFVVEPRVPRRMPVAGMAKLVGIGRAALPGRFQLRVDGSRPLPIANGRIAGDDVVFSDVLADPEDLTAIADREIRWFLQAGRRIGDSFAPRGGAGPADDLPWVFAATEEDESRLDLYAEGSVRTRFPRVAVACLEETARMLLPHPDCRPWKTQPITGRVMLDVEGDVSIDTPVGTCRIRTAQEQERQFEHRLVGKRCFDFAAPLPVYHHAPSLSAIESEGTQRRVPTAQVSWHAARGDEWVRNPGSPGVWRVRREVDGETVFLSKICLAGADFSAKVVPGRESTRGFVDIRGASLDVACEHPHVNVETERQTDLLRVTVHFVPDRVTDAGGGPTNPPSHVALATRWPNGSTLPMTVPFPGRGARFVHPDLGDADRRRSLSVDSLYGWRALAISPKTMDTLRLVGELRADDLDERMRAAAYFEVALQEIGDGVSELPLVEIHDALESLFAATKLLDARIHLELAGGGIKPSSTVVRRFACGVEVSEESLFSVRSRCIPAGAPVSFEAFSLESPGLGRTPLEPADGDGEVEGWKIPDAALPQQTRIVLARSGDQYFARPFIDPSDRPPLDAAEARSLAQASSISNMENRIGAMRRILQDMVEGGGDENWEYLADLLDVSRGLPATTFDALDCLSDNPSALVRLLLRTPQEEARARIWRLEYELPFTWLLVPVQVWVEEMIGTHRAIRKELEDVGAFAPKEVRQRADERLTQVAAEAARFCRGLTLLGHFADDATSDRRIVPQVFATAPPRSAFCELCRDPEGPYQVLLRAGSDFRWPAGPDRDNWVAEIALLTESPWKDVVWVDCERVGFRRPLTDAPFGAAFSAASGVRVSRRLVHATKLLRSHAPEWFDAAYGAALARIFGVDLDVLNHD